MSGKEIVGLILSYVYAFSLLLLFENVGKRFRWPIFVTRKMIHIGAGLWVFGILYFFDHWYFGIIPFASFIFLNYLFYKKQTFKQMDEQESSPGTVYFAVSITLLFLLFWRPQGPQDLSPIAVAAVMAMTIGDAFASLLGFPYGRKKYSVWGNRKSWIGSAAMMVFSFFAILFSLHFLPGSILAPHSPIYSFPQMMAASVTATFLATIAEAVSPKGMDNLTVPLLTAAVLVVMLG